MNIKIKATIRKTKGWVSNVDLLKKNIAKTVGMVISEIVVISEDISALRCFRYPQFVLRRML